MKGIELYKKITHICTNFLLIYQKEEITFRDSVEVIISASIVS